jgi:hypothetical protein
MLARWGHILPTLLTALPMVGSMTPKWAPKSPTFIGVAVAVGCCRSADNGPVGACEVLTAIVPESSPKDCRGDA